MRAAEDQDREHRHLHLVGLDLLAEVLGRAATIRPGDEDREDREEQHAVEPGADAAEDRPRRAAMLTSGTRPPSGVKLSCMLLTAPQEASVVTVANRAELAIPKRTSLPSMLPPACASPARMSTPSRRGSGCPRLLDAVSDDDAGEEEQRHRREERPAVPRVAHHPAERVGEAARDREDQRPSRGS